MPIEVSGRSIWLEIKGTHQHFIYDKMIKVLIYWVEAYLVQGKT
jgi:hypothetical protein